MREPIGLSPKVATIVICLKLSARSELACKLAGTSKLTPSQVERTCFALVHATHLHKHKKSKTAGFDASRGESYRLVWSISHV